METREFIKNNRGELDKYIRRVLDDPNFNLNDNDRENWIMNEEGLYDWAILEGVKI